MKIMKCKLLVLLILVCAGLAGLEPGSYSAFSQPVKDEFQSSLLNCPEAEKADSILIYDDALAHPFKNFGLLGDAVLDAFRTGNPHYSLLGYQSPDKLVQAEFNILAGYEPVFAESLYAFFYKGFRIKSSIGRHCQMNTHWWNGMFFGNQAEAASSSLIDGYNRPSNGRINLDNVSGDLSYNAKNLLLSVGRGKFPLGNSISGSVILNDRVNDYAYLLAEGKAGAFSLSFLHGSLKADSTLSIYSYPAMNSKTYPDKYIAVHQLGYHPGSKLNLFLGESVIYGNRSIDLNYLLPNAFWRATEHNLWDRDNVMIYAGCSYKPVNPLFLYAQLALDELSYGKINTNWWGNKYAIQGGARYRMPISLPERQNPEFTLELTAVRPFTYTHYLNHTMFSHDGRGLGYPKGSNLVDISASLKVPYSKRITWLSIASYTKQGSFGSDWRENYHDVFPGESLHTGTATWFQGSVTRTTELKSSLLIDIFAHHRLLAGIISTKTSAWVSQPFAAWQFVY